MTAPRVSVVIPAYNAAWCIRSAVDSVIAQTFTDRELIIVDDGSRDDTVELLADYGASVRVVSKQNGGLSSARNAGIAAACGDFVAFLDADDWWLPEKLARQVALLDAHPEVGFCSTAARVVSNTGDTLGEWQCPVFDGSLLRQIFAHNAAIAGSGSAVLARRGLVDQVGGFDENLRSLEDIDMWMRLAAVTAYACVPQALTVIRKNPDSMSRNLDVMRDATFKVLRKNRQLLSEGDRGAFWQSCYATALADFAKWEYRSGQRLRALTHLSEGLLRAPVAKGRLTGGLMLAMVAGKTL